MGDKTILILEDDDNTQELVRYTLRSVYPNVRMIIVRDGDEALMVLRERPVDLLITDHMHEGTSGLDVIETIRKDRRLAPTKIILTTVALPDNAFAKAKPDAYLTKPFATDELLRWVKELIGDGSL
jgi:two-component system response regulator VicR